MAPRATRAQLLADPRSGVHAGAARGGIGDRHGEHDDGQPAGGRAPEPQATRPLPRATSSSSSSSSKKRSSSSKPPDSTRFPRQVSGPGRSTEPDIRERFPKARKVRPPAGPQTVPGTADGRQAARSRPLTSTISLEGGGLVVAAFAWPLALNLLKGGPAQMWGWVKAKFINEPYAGAAVSPSKLPGAYHGHTPSLGRKKG